MKAKCEENINQIKARTSKAKHVFELLMEL